MTKCCILLTSKNINHYKMLTCWFLVVYVATMAPWIDGKSQKSLNLAMISTISFPWSHLNWLFNIVFMARVNSCNTKCMVDFLIAKNLEQWKYWATWTNLYKLQAMWILTNIVDQNLVFIFSIQGINLLVRHCTHFLLTWKCSIQ